MSKYNRRNDSNETYIKNQLIFYGYHVEDRYDDLLIFDYVSDKMWQLEVKTHSPIQKNGKIESGYIKNKQYKQLCKANSKYFIAWDILDILKYIKHGEFTDDIINPHNFQKNFKKWLSTKELHRLRTSDKTKGWFNL